MPPAEPTTVVQQFEFLRANAGRVLGRAPTVAEVTSFIKGFDMATGYTAFSDFSVWLAVQLGGGYEYHWSALAECLAYGRQLPPRSTEATASEERAAVIAYLALVVEFVRVSISRDEMRDVYRRYDELRARDGLP